MKYVFRPCQTESDYWLMREFLRQVFILNNRRERSWHVARLDYARWHTCLNCAKVDLEEVAYLWESDGQLIAFLVSDGERGEAHFCVHPGLKTGELEEEMLDVAENHMAAVKTDSTHRLRVWSPGQDGNDRVCSPGVATGRVIGTNTSGDDSWTRPSPK